MHIIKVVKIVQTCASFQALKIVNEN